MAFNFAHLLSAACGGAPRRLGRLRRPWARCARLFWGGYQHRKSAVFSRIGFSRIGPYSPRDCPRWFSLADCFSLALSPLLEAEQL